VIFVGMGEADKKLRRYPHLFARVSHIVKYEPLSEKDVELAASELCDFPVDAAAVKALHERSGGGFREVMILLNQVERAARANKAQAVDAELVKALTGRAR